MPLNAGEGGLHLPAAVDATEPEAGDDEEIDNGIESLNSEHNSSGSDEPFDPKVANALEAGIFTSRPGANEVGKR